MVVLGGRLCAARARLVGTEKPVSERLISPYLGLPRGVRVARGSLGRSRYGETGTATVNFSVHVTPASRATLPGARSRVLGTEKPVLQRSISPYLQLQRRLSASQVRSSRAKPPKKRLRTELSTFAGGDLRTYVADAGRIRRWPSRRPAVGRALDRRVAVRVHAASRCLSTPRRPALLRCPRRRGGWRRLRSSRRRRRSCGCRPMP